MQDPVADQPAEAPHASFTGRFTAGLRYVESTRVQHPIIASDPLAGLLAGERGLALAQQELKQLSEAQGPGRHLRVPARSRLIDDILQQEIAALQQQAAGDRGQGGPICQVVSLGAGMCTRAWRLAALAPCRVIELDLPAVADAKRALLAEAGAQLSHGSATPAATMPAASPAAEAAVASDPTGSAAEHGSALPPAPQPAYPLLASSYALIGVDLSVVGPTVLSPILASAGFDPRLPTLWVLEALLYYMPLAAASELLTALADASAPGSRLVATCVDRELLEASRSGVPKGHVFADLWHFESEELLYGTEAFAARWQVDWAATGTGTSAGAGEGATATKPGTGATSSAAPPSEAAGASEASGAAGTRPLPPSTRVLARERLGAETYVALYGGSELLFVAGLR